MRFGYCNEALARQPAYKLKGRPHTNSKADRIQTQRQTAYKLKGRPHTNFYASNLFCRSVNRGRLPQDGMLYYPATWQAGGKINPRV
jgi:hypothetical protein